MTAKRWLSIALTWRRLRRNPALAIVVGLVLLVMSFVLPGATRDLIFRVAGGLAILGGVGMWLAARRT